MIQDEELDLIEQERNQTTVTVAPQPHEEKTAFEQKMDEAKVNILQEAAASDQDFVDKVTNIAKEAAVQSVTNEKKRAEVQGQKIDYESEKLDTQQKQNEQQQNEDKWANKQKCREFHYNGVKPIMEFVGIKSPMNLFLLYSLTFVLVWFFLISKLWSGTIGALISGASDGNRSKAAKGFIWTILGIFTLFCLLAVIYLFLKWQGIDIIHNNK